MGNYRELNDFIKRYGTKRILIVDSNNLEFCSQNEAVFTPKETFQEYDLLLIPEWVYTEISHSEKRLQYLASIDKPYLIISEDEDYLELIQYEEQRLARLFEYAALSISPARKFFQGLKKYFNQHTDYPEHWIFDFYETGFETRVAQRQVTGEWKEEETKINAGETSMLTLAYLLTHHYQKDLELITLFTTDKGGITIKEHILDNMKKIGLTYNSETPISFKSTDLLLIEAYEQKKLTLEEIRRIRTNSKTVIFMKRLPGNTYSRQIRTMDTAEFITVLQNIQSYITLNFNNISITFSASRCSKGDRTNSFGNSTRL